MGTVSAAQGYASDSGECTACMECVADCPQSAIRWAPGRRYAWNRAYDPSRRHALGMVGLGLAGAALAGVTPEAHHPNDTLLRPPGAREADLLSACARCGACMRACPTHGLQPATTEAGLAGFWTPVLVPRLGQCDYACNACGQACPTGAVPLLSLEEKRLTPIGKAFVDRNLCLAWSGRAPCIVCEEMCPLPDKAIVLEAVEAVDPWGNAVTYQAPVVRHERCIGCGICEYRCPVVGEAAIRVRVDPLA
jgi:MauM/NapG family ferredoxin protein